MRSGVNDSEKFLIELAQKSFLSSWSYANPYKSDKKELVDLLVYLEPYCILFSDKTRVWNDVVDKEGRDISWKRWYKHAVTSSITQLQSATQHLKNRLNNDFLYHNKNFKKIEHLKFPKETIYFRVATTYGSEQAIVNKVFNDEDIQQRRMPTFLYTPIKDMVNQNPFNPDGAFTVGYESDRYGYIHVMNRSSLVLLLTELDTIPDFVDYLIEKENNYMNPKIFSACGEEDLLAFYFQNFDTKQDRFRLLPNKETQKNLIKKRTSKKERRKIKNAPVYLGGGHWEKLIQNKQYKAKKEADKISYFIDYIVEYIYQDRGGEAYSASWLEEQDKMNWHQDEFSKLFEHFAGMRRVYRRQVGRALYELMHNKTSSGPGSSCRRMFTSFSDESIGIMLLCASPHLDWDYQYYRHNRQEQLALGADRMKGKKEFHHVKKIIAIATESAFYLAGSSVGQSYDYLFWDCENLTDEMKIAVKQSYDYLESMNIGSSYTRVQDNEFPQI
jgi:hypothetical protein